MSYASYIDAILDAYKAKGKGVTRLQRVLSEFLDGLSKEQAKKLVNHLAKHAIAGNVLTTENQKILRELEMENTIRTVEKVKTPRALELEAALADCITAEEATATAVEKAAAKLSALPRLSSHRLGYEENAKRRKTLSEELETAEDIHNDAALATRNAARALSGLPPLKGRDSGRSYVQPQRTR